MRPVQLAVGQVADSACSQHSGWERNLVHVDKFVASEDVHTSEEDEVNSSADQRSEGFHTEEIAIVAFEDYIFMVLSSAPGPLAISFLFLRKSFIISLLFFTLILSPPTISLTSGGSIIDKDLLIFLIS
mmetsp:Transcript_12696/g.12724  ORF Transcript_12696/g.12724 Transcript_12696/m.12724 type:complete len:129 (+) Transcript_12696:122-508(+)